MAAHQKCLPASEGAAASASEAFSASASESSSSKSTSEPPGLPVARVGRSPTACRRARCVRGVSWGDMMAVQADTVRSISYATTPCRLSRATAFCMGRLSSTARPDTRVRCNTVQAEQSLVLPGHQSEAAFAPGFGSWHKQLYSYSLFQGEIGHACTSTMSAEVAFGARQWGVYLGLRALLCLAHMPKALVDFWTVREGAQPASGLCMLRCSWSA